MFYVFVCNKMAIATVFYTMRYCSVSQGLNRFDEFKAHSDREIKTSLRYVKQSLFHLRSRKNRHLGSKKQKVVKGTNTQVKHRYLKILLKPNNEYLYFVTSFPTLKLTHQNRT